MTGMYDGVDVRVPQRCLGCADGIVVKTHHCAGGQELLPYGGTCACTRPGCGPNPNRQPKLSVGKPARTG